MKKILVYILFLSIISTAATCHKPCNEPNYSFETGVKFSPESDSLHVGDTIWITSSIPNPVLDNNSGKAIIYENANWGSTLIISDILEFRDSNRGAVADFSYFAKTGSIYSMSGTDTMNVKQLSYQENISGYEFKIGIVAGKKGLYILTIPDNPYLFRKGNPKCGTANLVILNQNNNKHVNLFEDKWGPLSSYDVSHSYCLKVY